MRRPRLVDEQTRQALHAWLGEPLATAGYGDIHPLLSDPVRPTPFTQVVKTLPNLGPPALAHTRQVLNLIHTYRTQRGVLDAMLPGLPTKLVRVEGSNDLALVMGAIRGQSLGDLLESNQKAPVFKLAIRLRLAAKLSLDVEALHRHHFIHGDLSRPNLMLDIQGIEAGEASIHLVDFDGMGYLSGSGTPCPPLHLGRNFGSSLAPELHGERPAPVSQLTDRWGRAYLLHQLVFGYLDPYPPPVYSPHNPGIRAIYGSRPNWPQHQPTGHDLGDRYRARHRRTWEQLHPEVRLAFRRVFDYVSSGGFDPELRPSPLWWNHILYQASASLLKAA